LKPVFGENYQFSWKDLGDVHLGRPNLANEMPVSVYRLAQYTMRETLCRRFGDEMAALLLRQAGWVAGREFCLNVLDITLDPPEEFSAVEVDCWATGGHTCRFEITPDPAAA